MNLNALATAVTGAITPTTIVTITVDAGYTTAADGTTTPTPATPMQVYGQVQALTQADLRQTEGLNIQGQLASVYLPGQFAGVIRASQQGGTQMAFNGQNWLVVLVPEQWADWTRVVVCLQR